MKRNLSQRALSLLLTLAMLVGLVPATVVPALAGASVPEAIYYDANRKRNEWDNDGSTDGYLEQDTNGKVTLSLSGGVPEGNTITKVYLVTDDSAHTRKGTIYDNGVPSGATGGLEGTNSVWIQNVTLSLPVGTYRTEYVTNNGSMYSQDMTESSWTIPGTVQVVAHGQAPAVTPTVQNPTLSVSPSPATSGITGETYSEVTFTATRGQTDSELSWSATGLGGSGLTFTGANDSTTATLSGTLRAAGRYSITITVTENGTEERTASYSFILTIHEKPKAYFDPNNGESYTSQEVTPGTKVTLPGAPTYTGYQFMGWYSGNTRYDPGAEVTVTSDQWFYAVWEGWRMTVRLGSGNPVVGPLQLKGVKSGGTEEYIGYRYYDQPTSLVGDGANSFKVFVPDIVDKGYTGLRLYATVDGAYDTLIGHLDSFSVTTNNDSTVELISDGTWYILADELKRADSELPVTDKDFDYYIIKTDGRTISRPAMVSSETSSDYTLKIRGSWRSEYEKSYKWAGTYHSHVGGNSDGAFSLGADGYTLTPKLDLSKLKLTTDAHVTGSVQVKDYRTNTLVQATAGSTVYATQEVDGITRSFQTTVDENGNYALNLYPGTTATLWARDKLTSVSTNRVTTGTLTTDDATVNLSSEAPAVEVKVTVTPASGNEAVAARYLKAVDASVGMRINAKDWDWIYMGQPAPLTRTKTVYPSSVSASDQTGIAWSASGDYFHEKSGTFPISDGKGTINVSGLQLRPGALLNLTFEKNNNFRFAWFNENGTLAAGTWSSYPDSGDNAIRAPQTVNEGTVERTDTTGTLILALIPETYFNWVTKDTTLSGKNLTLGDRTFENAVTETWTVSLSDNHITDLGSYTVTAAAGEDATYVTKPKSTLTTGATGFSSTNDIISFTGTVDIDNGFQNGKLEYLYLNTNVGYDYTGSVVEAVVNGEKMSVNADHWKSTSGVYLDFHTAPLDLPVTYTVYVTPISVERDLVMTVEAQVSYDDRSSYSGAGKRTTKYRELVGSATVAKPGMALSYLSPYVNSKSITLSGEGIAKRSNGGVGEIITFYDGEVQVAQAQTDWWGDWKVDVPLYNIYDTDPKLITTHTITARRADGSISTPLTVVHCADGPELTKFQWSFGADTDGGHDYKRNVGEGYAFWGTVTNPKFYATFTNGDKLKTLEGFGVPVVFRIITTDGQIRYLPATKTSDNEYTAQLTTVLRSAISGVECLFDPDLPSGITVSEDGKTRTFAMPQEAQDLLAGLTVANDDLAADMTKLAAKTPDDSWSVTYSTENDAFLFTDPEGLFVDSVTYAAETDTKLLLQNCADAGLENPGLAMEYDGDANTYALLNSISDEIKNRTGTNADAPMIYSTITTFLDKLSWQADQTFAEKYAQTVRKMSFGDYELVSYTISDSVMDDDGNFSDGTYLINLCYVARNTTGASLYAMAMDATYSSAFSGYLDDATLVSNAASIPYPLVSSAGPLTGDMLTAPTGNLVSRSFYSQKRDFAPGAARVSEPSLSLLKFWGDISSEGIVGTTADTFSTISTTAGLGSEIAKDAGNRFWRVVLGRTSALTGKLASFLSIINIVLSERALEERNFKYQRMKQDILDLMHTKCKDSLSDYEKLLIQKAYTEFCKEYNAAIHDTRGVQDWANLMAIIGTGATITGVGAVIGVPVLFAALESSVQNAYQTAMSEWQMVNIYNSTYNQIAAIMYKANTEDCNKNKKRLGVRYNTYHNTTYSPVFQDAGSTLPITIGHDPAGIVYEGVIENPVKDATVTLYYAVDASGNPLQENSNHTVNGTVNSIKPADDVKALVPREAVETTRENGRFQWGVPEGLWFVVATKDGLTGTSDNDKEAKVTYSGTTTNGVSVTHLLPVLPIQLDVNIPLVDPTAPVTTGDEAIQFTTEGVYVTYSKYMEDTTNSSDTTNYAKSVLNPDNYVLQTAAGQNIDFTVTAVTQGHTPENRVVSSDVRNTVASRTYTKAVKLTPKTDADKALYAGSAQLLIRGRVVSYAGTPIGSDYVSGARDIETPAQLSTPTFSGTDSGNTNFTGLTVADKVIPTGNSVALTAAAGVTIYYTINGTDPLENGTPKSGAKTYDGPIAVNNKITVWARAVRVGAKPSEIAKGTFTPYTMVNHGVVVTVVSADPTLSVDGVTVTLNGQTRTVSGGAVGFYGLAAGTYTLTFPQSNRFNAKSVSVEVPEDLNRISISITLEKRTTSSGGGNYYLYGVKVTDTDHGSVAASTKSALPDTKIILTVNPDEGYELDIITVEGATLSETSDGKYTFVMPARQVTVTASFREKAVEPTPPVNPFPDVAEGAWYYDAVRWAARNGITNGKPGGIFDPLGNATRAEVITFLWRCAGKPAPKGTTSPFSDVAEDAWYLEPVLWAAEKGIALGFGDGTFRPNTTVTREQFVAFLYRMVGTAVTGANPFTDVDADNWSYEAILWAAKHAITNGTGDGLFSPDWYCDRGQTVTMLYRWFGK